MNPTNNNTVTKGSWIYKYIQMHQGAKNVSQNTILTMKAPMLAQLVPPRKDELLRAGSPGDPEASWPPKDA